MFGGLSAMIACVAHVGFDRLLKFVKKLNAGDYSFENDFALEASNLTFDMCILILKHRRFNRKLEFN